MLTLMITAGSLDPVAVAFSSDGVYLATANSASNDVTLFNATNGVLKSIASQVLPAGSKKPRSLVFVPTSTGEFLVATANSDSNDITIFPIKVGRLSAGTSYPLPAGAVEPVFIAVSSNGAYLATANSGSNSITLFSSINDILDQGTSYYLPDQSSDDEALTFSPLESSGNMVIVTANKASNDVSVFPLLGTSTGTGDGGSNLPLGVIIGTTVGVPVAFGLLAVTGAVTSCLLYKYLHKHRAGSVNFGDESLTTSADSSL